MSAQLEAGEAAGLSEIVQLIQHLSGNAVDTSVQELATIIGKDVVVTAKVITVANTLGYNPAGTPVTTISQAIHVIGFNKIRQLAVSLLLIENAERTLNGSEKREIAALALCSGMVAESITEKRGILSPEQAFICASLRNYGRILMTTFMIEEYRQAIIIATNGITEDEAFLRVFGLTPLELGYHLLASAHLPGTILTSLQKISPDAVKQATEKPEMELLLLADFSVQVCELALRKDVSADEFARCTRAIASKSGSLFGLDANGVVDVLREASQQLNTFATTFGLTALSKNLAPRLQARVTKTETPPPERVDSPSAKPVASAPSLPPQLPVTSTATTFSRDKTPVEPPAAEDSIPAAPEVTFQKAFDRGIEELAGLLEQDTLDLDQVFKVVSQAATKGFGSHESIIFVREGTGHRYLAKYPRGDFSKTVQGQLAVRDDERDVFGICLQRMEDVLIYDAADPKIAPHLPAWQKRAQIGSFVLLPMSEAKRPFAVLFAGWHDKKTAGFSVTQIRQVRSMLKLAGTARRLTTR